MIVMIMMMVTKVNQTRGTLAQHPTHLGTGAADSGPDAYSITTSLASENQTSSHGEGVWAASGPLPLHGFILMHRNGRTRMLKREKQKRAE